MLLVATSLILLSACKSRDLSGTYYYVENLNKHIVHQINIRKDVNDEKKGSEKYVINEIGNNGITSDGTLVKDKSVLTIKLKYPSKELSSTGPFGQNDTGGDITYDISKATAIPYIVNNDGFSLGKSQDKEKITFYKAESDMGKKYQKVWNGQESWEKLFK